MQEKSKFEIFTTEQFKFIPENVIIVKNLFGWVFLYIVEGQVYTNSTDSGANCKDSENETWLKRIVKKLKEHMKTVQ